MKKQGFTLVELIIVIAIIAVLAVAAFMMLTKWLGKSRDSRKLGDIETISKSLMIWMTDTDNKSGLLPDPDDEGAAQFDGTDTFTQGVFGHGTIGKMQGMQKAPLNPSNQKYYIYSRTTDKRKYQIATEMEDGTEATALVNRVSAGERMNRVRGNFTPGIYLFETGSNYIAVYLPGIVIAGATGATTVDLGSNQVFVFDGKTENLVETLGNVTQYKDIIEGVNEPLSVLWSGLPGEVGETAFMTTIESNLSGVVEGEVDLGVVTSLFSAAGTNIEVPLSLTPSCLAQPSYTNATYTEGTPTGPGIEWQNDDNGAACYYACTNGYFGDECNILLTPPSNLSLTHTSGEKTFTVSWIAGDVNAGNCKLQYYKDGTTWTNISETEYDCTNNITDEPITLPEDGWNGSWSNMSIRIIRVSDDLAIGTFPGQLTCTVIAGSEWPTLEIDENCNGTWDDLLGVGPWVELTGAAAPPAKNYYYGAGGNATNYNTSLSTIAACQDRATSRDFTYVSYVEQGYSNKVCYANNTGYLSYYDDTSDEEYYVNGGLHY